MMQLYWSPRSRSFSALWLMEETGQPYERVLTDITTGAQKTPEYLAINPMGKVPALKDGDATLGEAAAICAYVAERYPEAKLAPPLGDPLRARYLLLAVLLAGCIEPAMVQIATKIEMNLGRRRLGRSATQVFDVLDAALAEGPVDPRRAVLRRRHRDRLGPEFRGAAVQDGAVAAVVRRLYRALRGPAGIPARREDRGGITRRLLRFQLFRPRHRDDVVAGIDIVDLAGDAARQIRQQIERGAAELIQRHAAAERRMLLHGRRTSRAHRRCRSPPACAPAPLKSH